MTCRPIGSGAYVFCHYMYIIWLAYVTIIKNYLLTYLLQTCLLVYAADSGERLQDHWSSGFKNDVLFHFNLGLRT